MTLGFHQYVAIIQLRPTSKIKRNITMNGVSLIFSDSDRTVMTMRKTILLRLHEIRNVIF